MADQAQSRVYRRSRPKWRTNGRPDFAGAGARNVPGDGHNGSGINPRAISGPFAPAMLTIATWIHPCLPQLAPRRAGSRLRCILRTAPTPHLPSPCGPDLPRLVLREHLCLQSFGLAEMMLGERLAIRVSGATARGIGGVRLHVLSNSQGSLGIPWSVLIRCGLDSCQRGPPGRLGVQNARRVAAQVDGRAAGLCPRC